MSTRGAVLSPEIQQGVEQQLLGAGLSPVTAQLCASASPWANHNGPEETNGNEAGLLLANQERGVAESNSSGGKTFHLGLLMLKKITLFHKNKQRNKKPKFDKTSQSKN